MSLLSLILLLAHLPQTGHGQHTVFEDVTAQQFTNLAHVTEGNVAWGDYNNDGRLDLVINGITNDTYGETVTWTTKFYQNTSGGFVDQTNLLSKLSLDIWRFPEGYRGFTHWADFDNNGWLDLAISNHHVDSNPRAVYSNTGGEFTISPEPLSLAYRDKVAWADYDNDGRLDPMIVGDEWQWLGNSYLYRNTPNGYVNQSALLPYLPQLLGASVGWGDYDSDGWPDLFISGGTTKLYHNEGDGKEFTNETRLVTGLFGSPFWADYDSDGKLDLLVITGAGTRLQRNFGSGFEDKTSLIPGAEQLRAGSAAWADYDNDGRLDLLFTGAVSRLYRNTPDGFVNVTDQLPDLPREASAGWADFDNDGRMDLMVIGKNSNGIASRLYRNTGTPANTPPTVPSGLTSIRSADGTSAVLSWQPATDVQTPQAGLTYNLYVSETPGGQNVLSPSANQTTGMRQVAREGNSRTRFYPLTGLTPGKTYYWSVQAIDGVFTGSTFAAEQTISNAAASNQSPVFHGPIPNQTAQVGSPFSFTLPAGLFTDPENQVLTITCENLPEGLSFRDGQTISGTPKQVGSTTITLKAADPLKLTAQGSFTLTVNQAPVIVTGNFINVTAQQFPGLPQLRYSAVSWADFDNDGRLDFIITGSNSEPVTKLYRNTGSGFVDATGLIPNLPQVYEGVVAWGDYNNDGRQDLFINGMTEESRPLTTVARLFRNTPNGFVDESNLVPHLANSFLSDGSVAWADVDNDGWLDLIRTGFGEVGNAASALYRNTGQGFASAGAFSDLPQLGASNVAWGDYDNDGRLDLMITGRETNADLVSKLLHNTGSGFEDKSSLIPGLLQLHDSELAWGDYDNDGWLDLIMTGRLGSSMFVSKLYRNTGSGFEDKSNLISGLGGSPAWADYDNDGRLDLLCTGNRIALYRNTPDGFVNVTAQHSDLVSANYSSGAWGDYDNDGRLDLLNTGYAGGRSMTRLYRNTSAIANTRPTAPSGLTSVRSADGKSAVLSWKPATDGQTPQVGLTYNLYVSETPGGQNVLSPSADQNSGFRRVVRVGNSRTTTYPLTGLTPERIYYWSVQAIDGAFAGSAFAEEQRIDNNSAKNLPPVFHGPIPNQTVQEEADFHLYLLNGLFTDPENQPLTLTAQNLPKGLSIQYNAVHGVPTQTGKFTVTVTATDHLGLTVQGSFLLTVVPQPPSIDGSLDGYLDKVECGTIRGWAWNRDKPNTPVLIEIFTGNTGWGFTVANIYREDLKNAGKGNGAHAFSFKTPDALKDKVTRLISARVSGVGSTYVLKLSGQLLTCADGPGVPKNEPPRFHGPMSSQSAQQGHPFSFALPAGTFTDPENHPLTLTAQNLPNGLSMRNNVISGTPTQVGSFTVVLKAADPLGLTAQGSFVLTVTPGPPSISGNFDGYLDKVECGTMRGWVWNRDKPNTPVRVEFFTGNTVWGSTMANIFRQDLKDSGKGNGAHAYSFTTPATLKDNTTRLISARVEGSAFELKWSGKSLICPPPAGRLSVEAEQGFQAIILGNPVTTHQIVVEIRGGAGKPLNLQLLAADGRVLSERQVEKPALIERQVLPLDQQPPSLLLVRVTSGTSNVILKVIKH
ncbi:hypothetical protein GCM10027299_41740 [Larkinella ripae]